VSNSAASVQGKAGPVTGAVTGIGKAIAAALAAAGARVVVNHDHAPEPAGKVVVGIETAGTAIAVAADISGRAECQAMVEQLLTAYGRWDTLVNNAAATITRPFPQITEAEFDISFAVNVKGVLHGLQLAGERLADNGRIITISSSTTGFMLPGYPVYVSTNGAVEQFAHRSSGFPRRPLRRRRVRRPDGAGTRARRNRSQRRPSARPQILPSAPVPTPTDPSSRPPGDPHSPSSPPPGSPVPPP